MVCLFIPIVFGCSNKLSQLEQTHNPCPRCGNASLEKYRERKWFELCWVPLVPLGSKEVWFCNICQLNTPIEALQPQPQSHQAGKMPQQGFVIPTEPEVPRGKGYDVGYYGAGDGFGGKAQ